MGDYAAVRRIINHITRDGMFHRFHSLMLKVQIDSSTYVDIMTACLLKNNLSFAEEIYNKLKGNNSLTTDVFNKIIEIYVQNNQLDSVYSTLDEIYRSRPFGVSPNPETYLALAIHLTKHRRFDEVRFLFREIQDYDVQLDIKFYNSVLDAFLASLEADEVAEKEHNVSEYVNAITNKITNKNDTDTTKPNNQNSERFLMTRFILDILTQLTTISKATPDWLTFQILLKISKRLDVLELQQNIVRAAKKASLPTAFVEEMWEFVKGETE